MKLSINGQKLLISTLVAVILVIGLWKFCPIMYQNNDDKFLLYMMAGYTTGVPQIESIFGGVVWAGLVAAMYHLTGRITWYTVLTLLVIFVSVVFIIRSLLASEGMNRKTLLNIGFIIAVFCGVLAYFISALQYTVTATYAGVAGVCALLLCLYEENRRWSKFYFIISCILFVLSYSIRKQMGLVTISCYAFAIFYGYIKQKQKNVIKAAIILLVVMALTIVSNSIYEQVSGIATFNDYYKVVQRWIDYPHLDIRDDEEGIYSSVGWDEELYDAANEWFFLDERVNEESIDLINKAGAKEDKSFAEKFTIAKDGITNKQMVNVQVGIWLFVLIVSNICFIKRRHWAEVIVTDVIFLFFLMISVYFCFSQGRFPLRVYQALVIMYAIPSFVIIINQLECEDYKFGKTVIYILPLLIILSLYKIYPAGSMLYQLKLATHDTDRQKYIGEVMELERYASENTDNLYLYDFELSQPAAPFVNYEKAPYNIMFWGGWTYNSPVYYKQLEANGRKQLAPEDLVNGNVYLCGKYHDEIIIKYMESVFGEIAVEDVDQVGDVLIYRFVK